MQCSTCACTKLKIGLMRIRSNEVGAMSHETSTGDSEEWKEWQGVNIDAMSNACNVSATMGYTGIA